MSHATYFAIHGHTNLCIEVKQKNIKIFGFLKNSAKLSNKYLLYQKLTKAELRVSKYDRNQSHQSHCKDL